MIQKPITVARREFVEALGKLTGDSGLPFSMLADIFKEACVQMEQLEAEQYERDRRAYEEALKNSQNKEN